VNADVARAPAVVVQARAEGRTALSEQEAKSVLAGFGIPVPRGSVVPRGARASDSVNETSGPYAVKVVSPEILHKSDVGGVRVGVARAALDSTIAEMDARITAAGLAIQGWLVEEMAPSGVEVVIGGTVDPRFGPCVMVGLGGVFVEVLADVAFRLCPIDSRDAHDMLEELRGVKLLRGWRGAALADERAVVAALLAVGGEGGLMMTLSGSVTELDINPLIVSPKGAVAADARIILKDS
jgi:succinyl-CoA synthetase beta subunit